jgi:poly-gamma-glutamate synthesis protein (capsule biosynthesis protein)
MSRLRSAARWTGIGVGALLLGGGAWSLFWLLYNPKVSLLEPVVVQRAASGDESVVVLGGDFAPADAAMPRIEKYGYRYPYGATANLLRDADIAFANLEAPVTASTDRYPLWRRYFYRVEPVATEAWQWLGLDIVSLANNHMNDYRERGLLDTARHLDDAGIAHVGSGATESEARRPVIFDVGGTRIGFLAYLQHKAQYNLYLRLYAIGDRVGVAQLNRVDLEQDVRRLRPLVDVLVVSAHWGQNYADVTSTQRNFARWMTELGVDVVAGHHPHDVQSMEVRDGKLVFYSLGNYAWGAPGKPHMRVGFLARLHIRPRTAAAPARITAAELLPIVTQNRIVNYQPRPIRENELEWLDPFLEASAARGTELELEGTTVRIRGLD